MRLIASPCHKRGAVSKGSNVRRTSTTETPSRCHVLPGLPPVTVELARSPRAMRLTLRVSRLDGRVRLTLPRRLPMAEALAFLRDREAWLRAQLARQPAAMRPGPGGTLPWQGREVPLRTGAVRRITWDDGALILPDDGRSAGPRLAAILKAQARDSLTSACDRHAAALGRSFTRITLRDTRSRWGSCSSSGALMFCWRIAMAPPQVLDYLAAHEVAHLARMDHSPAFWALVAQLCPGHKAARAWLRDQGDRLLRIDFADAGD